MKSPFAPYRPWYIIGKNNGQVPLERQFAGLNAVDVRDQRVLEIGCAEGLVSMEFAKRGAKLVHGVELLQRAVDVARSIAPYTPYDNKLMFFQGDLRNTDLALNQPGMLPQYDVVTAMAVLQKMPGQEAILKKILTKCAKTFVFRLGERKIYKTRILRTGWSFGATDPVRVIESAGFKMKWESCGYPKGEQPFPLQGEAWMAVFERQKS